MRKTIVLRGKLGQKNPRPVRTGISLLGVDYLRLRRAAAAASPSPRTIMVAGSGIASALIVTLSILFVPPGPGLVDALVPVMIMRTVTAEALLVVAPNAVGPNE